MFSKNKQLTVKTVEKVLKPVIVCTSRSGIFFGYTDLERKDIDLNSKPYMDIANVRMCIEWLDIRGPLDLAVSGPNYKCKISPAIDYLKITEVNGVFPCTPKAAEEWEKGYWYDPE